MRKLFTLFLIVIVLFIGFKIGNFAFHKIKDQQYIKDVKKGWYAEVTTEALSIREFPTATSRKLGVASKGEIFKVIGFDTKDEKFYWYNIQRKDGSKAWLANPKATGTYLKDYNGEDVDVAAPKISFTNNDYKVTSISKINYDHLEVWDDRDDYKISHIVCHEINPEKETDQYWVKYTVKDKSGKTTSKMQKIIFEKQPKDDEVLDFSECQKES